MSMLNADSPFLKGLDIHQEKKKDPMKNVVKAIKAKEMVGKETLEEAWERIYNMKNSPAEVKRFKEVEKRMMSGELSRLPHRRGKKFSKAEVNELYGEILKEKREKRINEIVDNIPKDYILVDTPDKLELLKEKMLESVGKDVTGFDIETFSEEKGGALDPYRGHVAGFSWTWEGNGNYYLPLNHEERTEINKMLSDKEIIDYLKDALESVQTVMHNAPFDCKWMKIHYDVDMTKNLVADTRVMAFMTNEEERYHNLKYLTREWLGLPADDFDTLFPNTNEFNKVPNKVALFYAAGDTDKTVKLYKFIENIWSDEQFGLERIKKLFYEIEMPVLKQFVHSDVRGIMFDTELSEKLYYRLEEKLEDIQNKVEELYGQEINLNSPKQVQEMLFDHFKIKDPSPRGTRSTDREALEAMSGEHPVVDLIIQYRAESKLQSSFTKPLAEKSVNGVIHPDHNTLGAVTGRFTCSNPNTQQIPSRRNEFRHQFTARPGRILVALDYSQIELRVLAHDAQEKVLIEAFNEGRDIHSTTASVISGIPYEQIMENKDVEGSVEGQARDSAKTVNFGIVYGMSHKTLAKRIGVSEQEGKKIMDDYFAGYPGIEGYMEYRKREARNLHHVTDMFGRIRNFHVQMQSDNKWARFSAERQAGNFPIQSGAGIILKKAIVDLQPVLEKWNSFILLQVHDELVFDCPRDIPEEGILEIKETMENVVELDVPLVADVDIYPERWAEGVDYDEWFNKK